MWQNQVAHDVGIDRIVRMTTEVARFWGASHGWASKEAADMMAAARLDRQVSFTHTLHRYVQPFPEAEAEATLILGYVTLRSLCEGVLKLFCAVWWEGYREEADVPKHKAGATKEPGGMKFESLIAFYSRKIDSSFDMFLRRVQERGNAIHHFNDKHTGTQDELTADIVEFLRFLVSVNGRLPYPDEVYDPANA
jgi:hypothetical protein